MRGQQGPVPSPPPTGPTTQTSSCKPDPQTSSEQAQRTPAELLFSLRKLTSPARPKVYKAARSPLLPVLLSAEVLIHARTHKGMSLAGPGGGPEISHRVVSGLRGAGGGLTT